MILESHHEVDSPNLLLSLERRWYSIMLDIGVCARRGRRIGIPVNIRLVSRRGG